MRRLAVFFAGILLSAVAAHVAWSAILSAAYARLYPHRILNVRKLSDVGDYVPIAAGMLRAATGKRIVFAGASATFGYGAHQDTTYSWHFAGAKPDAVVLNLSIIGGNIYATAPLTVCAIETAGAEIDTLFIEFPPLSDPQAADDVLHGRPPKPFTRSADFRTCRGGGLFSYFAAHPKGVFWLSLLQDEYQERDARPVRLDPLPRNFMLTSAELDAVTASLSKRRKEFLSRLRPLARRVVAYPSPVYTQGLVSLGFDRLNIEKQMRDVIEDCRSVPGIECLDTTGFSEDAANFADVAHLGLIGHKRFAEFLGRD